MGRVTSDVVRGMSVTQFIGVGHIARQDNYFPAIFRRFNAGVSNKDFYVYGFFEGLVFD